MGGYYKGNLGKTEKPGEYHEEYLAQFIPTFLKFWSQKDPVHMGTPQSQDFTETPDSEEEGIC